MPQPSMLNPQPTNRTAGPVSRISGEILASWLLDSGSAVRPQVADWSAEDWSAMRHAILVHGLAPLLAYRFAETAAWAAFPLELQLYLCEQLAQNRRRIAAILGDLTTILSAAAAADLAVMPLKGAVLAYAFYPEPGLRPMADLDLLARPEDLPRVVALLRELGYEAFEETPRHVALARGPLHVVSYDGEHPDNPRAVELHTAVDEHLHGLRIDLTNRLWKGAMPAPLLTTRTLMPTATALMMHLLIHTGHNLYYRRLRLIGLYDLVLVAATLSSADWAELNDLMLHEQAARLLVAPLLLAERIFGPLAPPELSAAWFSALPQRLRMQLGERPLDSFSLMTQGEISFADRLAWYHPGAEWLGMLMRKAVPDLREVQQRGPQWANSPVLAYGHHYLRIFGWAVRRVSGTARPIALRHQPKHKQVGSVGNDDAYRGGQIN